MNVEKRLRALETRFIRNPVILYFADGSSRELRGEGDFLMRLLGDAIRGTNMTPGRTAQLDLIRQSVSAKEPGGGHLTELVKSFLGGPDEVPAGGIANDNDG